MTFGQYFKKRREELKLTQNDFRDFGQSYISKIEIGKNNPTKRQTIEELADVLQLPKNRIDWLWVYSLLDRDPELAFGLRQARTTGLADVRITGLQDVRTTGLQEAMAPNPGPARITLDTPEADVLTMLGQPDLLVDVPEKSKWIYNEAGLHIVFAEGKVADVEFK